MKKAIVYFVLFAISIFKIVASDAGVVKVKQPGKYLCVGGSFDLIITIKNFGTDTIQNFTYKVVMSGNQAGNYNLTYNNKLLPDSVVDLKIVTANITAPGFYKFVAYTDLLTDANRNNDTIIELSYVSSIPTSPTITTAKKCGAGSLTLSAHTNNALILWYKADTSLTVIFAGDTFKTPSLPLTTTYWVEPRAFNEIKVGPLNQNIGASSGTIFFNDAVTFDAISGFVLDSVTVYPSAIGNLVVRLLDASNNILKSKSFSITNATAPRRLFLGFTISPASSLKLDAQGSTCGLVRNTTGAVYPYKITDVVSITGNTLNPVYYLFFYDWKIKFAGCSGNRVPVKATIYTSKPHPNFNYVANTGVHVNFSNATPDADSIVWSFGDGIKSILYYPSHQYGALGSYTVKLYAFNDCGMDSITKLIQVPSGIESVNEENIKVWFNSSLNNLQIVTQNIKPCKSKINFYNSVGQLMSSSNFNLIPQQTYSIPIADNVSGFLLFEMYDEYGKILSRGKTIIVK